jgi:hypothetical protein
MDNMASGPNAIYFVQVQQDTLFIEILYGTRDGVPMNPSHIRVPADLPDWEWNAQNLVAVRNEAGEIIIQRK